MDYIDQIVAEIITGQPKEAVRAKAMDYGHEMEPEALAAYEALQGRMAEQSGFLRHPDYEFIGASPDFLVDEEGGGEIKCPMSIVVHATTLREGLPDEHIEQIQGGLFVTGRHWWDFVSFNPKFPPGLDLYVERVERDEEAISQIKADCLLAWEEVQMIVRELRSRQ
jgi:predicted phage-related endonuclease